MSATKLNMGNARRRRKLKALGRHKSEMYEASVKGDRPRLHKASGEFLAVARELGMTDAEAVRAADIQGRPNPPMGYVGHKPTSKHIADEIAGKGEIPMIRGRKLLSSDEWFQEGES